MSALYSLFEHDPENVGTGFPAAQTISIGPQIMRRKQAVLRQFDKRATDPY